MVTLKVVSLKDCSIVPVFQSSRHAKTGILTYTFDAILAGNFTVLLFHGDIGKYFFSPFQVKNLIFVISYTILS
jgi:hypothetical protein